MENLTTLEMSALIDMLAENTAIFTKILNEGGDTLEYERCKLKIAAIQKEIETRKQSFDQNSSTSTDVPDFTL